LASNSSDVRRATVDEVVLRVVHHVLDLFAVRPLVAVTWIDCSRPVSRSFARTETIPSALISNVTSIST